MKVILVIVVLFLLLLLALVSVLVSGRGTDAGGDRRAGAGPDQTWRQPPLSLR
jgi:hypothetical protein